MSSVGPNTRRGNANEKTAKPDFPAAQSTSSSQNLDLEKLIRKLCFEQTESVMLRLLP